jgi:hypothetical protein
MRLANALHDVRDDEACVQMVWIFRRYAQAAFLLGPRRQGGRYCPSYTDILVDLIRVSLARCNSKTTSYLAHMAVHTDNYSYVEGRRWWGPPPQ